MATDYPGAIDGTSKLPNPTTTSKTNSPSHAGLHANSNDAVKAVETKVGTGSSAPASNTLLYGTGAGTSAWQSLTSAQLAAVLSDETGTGSAVFATTPTLVTPKVDTINESTLSNGVTVAGMNVKSGVLSAPNTAIGTGGVSGANLATTAISLGYAQIVATVTTATTTTAVLVTGLTATVTIPAGGRRIRITTGSVTVTASAGVPNITVWKGTVGSGTQLGQFTGISGNGVYMAAFDTPGAGSVTYNIGLHPSSSGTCNYNAAATQPAFILVEAI